MSINLYKEIQGKLPDEIFDKILLNIGNLNLSIILENEYVINKLYNKNIHTWDYAAQTGNLLLIKFLNIIDKYNCTKKNNGLCITKWPFTYC